MVNVPAHTSKIGFFKETRSSKYYWGPVYQDFGNLSQEETRSTTRAVSYRTPTVKSNGVLPTNFSRKVGRIDSLSDVRVTTSSHKLEANQSIGFRGLTLDESPHGHLYSNGTVTPPSWLTNACIQGCIQTLNDKRALIMEDFFQAKQTVDMAVGIFNLIVKLFLLAWKRDWRGLRRLLRSVGHEPTRKVANGWLMFYYGIRPLVGTMSAILDSYEPRVRLLSATRKDRTPADPDEFVKGYSNCVTEGKAEWLVQCKLFVSVKQDSTIRAWNAFGFTGDDRDIDALILFWALTPYSFVVDWILPVERFLSTRMWSSGIDYQYGFVSKNLEADLVATELNPMTGGGDSGALPKARVRCKMFQRTTYNTYSPPSGLALNLTLTPTNLVNAAALIIQRR